MDLKKKKIEKKQKQNGCTQFVTDVTDYFLRMRNEFAK